MTIEQKAKFSKMFFLLGLLAWFPYIFARAIQTEISFVPFLGVHLIGVFGGIFFRKQSEDNESKPSQRKLFLRQLSTILLLLGVSVWGVYFGLKFLTGVEREITPFLIAHLSGVVSGAGIKVYNFVSKS